MGERSPLQTFLPNPRRGLSSDAEPSTEPSPWGFHRRLPEYAPTPLLELREVPAALGVGRVLAKDESERLGLPAFKMLGASWAAYRALCERLGAEPDWTTVEELGRELSALRPLTLTTATDGNHGRALARFAKLTGFSAHILVPEGTVDARIEAIRSEGASVEVVDGTYDDAVKRAGSADPESHLVVADTSWEGYTRIPGWVIDGYQTIFLELEEQLAEAGLPLPDVVSVPLGVGALGAASAVFAERVWDGTRPRLLGVEPDSAACVMISIERGVVTDVPGPHTSIMAGLNCGRPSEIAFPLVQRRFSAFVTVDDDGAGAAMVALAREGIVAGETGAASLAGITEAIRSDTGNLLDIGAESTVLLIVTEGATDPASFERIVGRAPERVHAPTGT